MYHPSKRRWIPPFITVRFVRFDALTQDNRQDFIFRKVRGILNKLTPENFAKLSNDLLKIKIDSDIILKGVILLIFDKALDEPQYSSMYAQLCKRLSDEAPNFETPSQNQSLSDQKAQNTFRILLLSKCKVEFENRSKASEDYENQDDLEPEEEERRQTAKRQMLGNIKFIGELGKLEFVSEAILHHCIQQLLSAAFQEDIEYLCQFMRTCGRFLDSDKGRNLMNQYFKRMSSLAESSDLPLRIRFMLRDVIELRRDGWVPRKATEEPMPINQIRNDQKESSSSGGGYYSHRDDRIGHRFLRKISLPRIDVDIVSSIPLSSLKISLPSNANGYSNNLDNNYHHNQRNGSARNYFPNENRHQNNFKHNQQQQHNALNYINNSKKESQLHFNKCEMPIAYLEKASLRPSTSMMLRQSNINPALSLNLFSGRPGEPFLRIHFAMDFTISRIIFILMSIIFFFFYTLGMPKII